MINKSDLQNLSNTKISDEEIITAEMHREVNDGLIDNDYADIIFDGGGGEDTIIRRGVSISSLSAQFVKQGRRVTVNGWFRQTSGTTIPSGTAIFTFRDSVNPDAVKLLPNDSAVLYDGGKNQFRGFATTPNGTSIQVAIRNVESLSTIGMYSLDAIPPNANTNTGNPSSAFYFSLTYFTKE